MTIARDRPSARATISHTHTNVIALCDVKCFGKALCGMKCRGPPPAFRGSGAEGCPLENFLKNFYERKVLGFGSEDGRVGGVSEALIGVDQLEVLAANFGRHHDTGGVVVVCGE